MCAELEAVEENDEWTGRVGEISNAIGIKLASMEKRLQEKNKDLLAEQDKKIENLTKMNETLLAKMDTMEQYMRK